MQLSHHPQARSLLEAIHAQPEDDLVRLVFADWLEEHGQLARAEFIRVQCERARLPSWERRALELAWREHDLLDEHGHLWFAEAPVLPGVFWAGFERGFLSHIHVPDLACLATNAETLRSVPGLRVTVQQIRRDEVARVPVLPSLRGLSCLETPETDSLTRLMEAPWTAPLTELDLTNLPIDGDCLDSLCGTSSPMRPERLALFILSSRPEHVEWLLDAPWFESVACLRLRGSFDLEDTTTGDEIASLFATMPGLGRLRELSLRGCQFRAEGLCTLLAANSLSGLIRLHLMARFFSWDPTALTGLPSRPNLKELGLGGFGLRAEDIPLLLSCNALTNLHSLELVLHSSQPAPQMSQPVTWPANLQLLDLRGSTLAQTHFIALLANLPWESLHSLNLDRIPLPAKVVQQLATGLGTGNLKVLSVRNCRLGDDYVQCLARERLQLWDLDFRNNWIGSAGMEALSQSPTLARTLRRLSLQGADVGDSGVEILTRQNWPELRELHLPQCKLSDVAIDHLTQAPHFERLVRLSLSQNAFSRDGLTRLFLSQMMARITHLGLNTFAREERSAEILCARPDLGRLRALGILGILKQPEECEQLARSSLPATCGVYWNVPQQCPSGNLPVRFPGREWARLYFRQTED